MWNRPEIPRGGGGKKIASGLIFKVLPCCSKLVKMLWKCRTAQKRSFFLCITVNNVLFWWEIHVYSAKVWCLHNFSLFMVIRKTSFSTNYLPDIKALLLTRAWFHYSELVNKRYPIFFLLTWKEWKVLDSPFICSYRLWVKSKDWKLSTKYRIKSELDNCKKNHNSNMFYYQYKDCYRFLFIIFPCASNKQQSLTSFLIIWGFRVLWKLSGPSFLLFNPSILSNFLRINSYCCLLLKINLNFASFLREMIDWVANRLDLRPAAEFWPEIQPVCISMHRKLNSKDQDKR